jgi:hypothetical protein
MTHIKTYGIFKNSRGRYAITTDISDDKKYYYASYSLTYVNPEFALHKAEQFIKSCHKDFVNFRGEQVHFEFKNMGLING